MSAVAAEDGVRFMQEMMELSSQQQKEQLPPRAIQIVSHPFFGRVVLTAGPAQFGTDLSKSSTGVSGFCSSSKPSGFEWALNYPPCLFFLREPLTFPPVLLRECFLSLNIFIIQTEEKMSAWLQHQK